MLSFGQTEEKFLYADIRGRDCYGGSGLCSVMPTETNKTTLKNIKIVKQSPNTILLEFETDALSIEEQKLHFGKELSKAIPNEHLFFTQDTDFIFDNNLLVFLNIEPKYNYIKKNKYPLEIQKDKLQITFILTQK